MPGDIAHIRPYSSRVLLHWPVASPATDRRRCASRTIIDMSTRHEREQCRRAAKARVARILCFEHGRACGRRARGGGVCMYCVLGAPATVIRPEGTRLERLG